MWQLNVCYKTLFKGRYIVVNQISLNPRITYNNKISMHQSKVKGLPPPEVDRLLPKCKIRLSKPAVLTLILSLLIMQAAACDKGSYWESSHCYPC